MLNGESIWQAVGDSSLSKELHGETIEIERMRKRECEREGERD